LEKIKNKGGEKRMSLAEDMKIIKNAELDIELLHRENDKLCAENNGEIANLEDKIKSTEFIMKEELKASKEDKIECKFDDYKGSIGWQKMPDKWTYLDKELMVWITSLPEILKGLFLKVTTTVKKGDLKKQIINDNDWLFTDSKIVEENFSTKDGEVFIHTEKKDFKVEGIEIEPQDPKFKYTIKKIK
jgi:hypothetical protein